MPERPSRPRKKAGVHGWRAFFMVFGCGTTAAVLVVAVAVGVLRFFVSTVEGGVQQPQAEGVAPTRGPVASLEPGSFDLCKSIENMQAFSSVAPQRTDDGNSFLDTALNNPGRQLRKIENSCVWDVQVGGLVPSEFALTYSSYISNDPESLAGDRSADQFDKGRSEIDGSVETVTSSGDLGGLEQGSYYAYGAEDGRDKIAYIGAVKTTVFSVNIVGAGAESTQEADLEAEYKALIIELLPEIRVRLNRVIPD